MDKDASNLSINKSVAIVDLTEDHIGASVKIRAFVLAVRTTKSVTFITLRDQLDTIQAIALNTKNENIELEKVANECFVEVLGNIKSAKPPVKSCTKQNFELEVTKLKVLGEVKATLPFNIKDACATEKERAANPSLTKVAYNLRLDNRFLDFRMPQTQAIIRIINGVMSYFRDYLRKKDFIEIKTPKIIQSGSEGGSNLFSVNYFDRLAYLAQSPQLYKQMAVIGGLKRVFEIGHVYRAEQQNTNRYLSEFVGFDIEMELENSYIDVIKFIYNLFVHIFDSLEAEYSRELEIIRNYRNFENLKYTKEPIIITHRECVDILNKKGYKCTYDDDFSKEEEKALGAVVKEMHDVDIFVVRDYPAACRAFYTYVDPSDGSTRSYDFIMRGEEILSGAQRLTDYEALKERIISKGINPKSLSNYLEPFKFGAPPHAGCGIGLERVLKSYFGFDDIRYFSLFPRDASRVYP